MSSYTWGKELRIKPGEFSWPILTYPGPRSCRDGCIEAVPIAVNGPTCLLWYFSRNRVSIYVADYLLVALTLFVFPAVRRGCFTDVGTWARVRIMTGFCMHWFGAVIPTSSFPSTQFWDLYVTELARTSLMMLTGIQSVWDSRQQKSVLQQVSCTWDSHAAHLRHCIYYKSTLAHFGLTGFCLGVLNAALCEYLLEIFILQMDFP